MTDAKGAQEKPSMWAPQRRGRRGPAPVHTRDAIVTAAIELADASGLQGVSMRAVGARLDSTAGSLYRHLSSRDDLVALMADRVVGELRPYRIDTDDWLTSMLAVGRRHLALYRRHPWLVEATSSVAGPESLAWFDNCLRILAPVQCPGRAKFEGIAMLIGVVSLFARSEANPPAPLSAAELADYPHLAATLAAQPPPEPEADLFQRTLRSLLTGLLGSEPI